MNIHTLKLPSAVSSGIRLTTTATHTHIHTEHYTPASHSSTSRSGPVGILQLGRVTEKVAHPVVKARTGSSLLSSALQIFSLPRMTTRLPALHVLRQPKKAAQETYRGGTCV